MSTQMESFVSFKRMPDHAVKIEWAATIHHMKDEETGKITCWIPAFNVYASASDLETVKRKAKMMVRCWFDHYAYPGAGLKGISLALTRKGFRTEPHIMTQLIRNKATSSTRFRPPIQDLSRDKDFQGASIATIENEHVLQEA